MRLTRWLPKATTVVAVVTLLLEVAPAPAAAQSYTLKIGNATLNDVQHEWQKRWGARVEKRAGRSAGVRVPRRISAGYGCAPFPKPGS
jgi:TRAP-type C4-dicarboxylate transport system substrate-binding protein